MSTPLTRKKRSDAGRPRKADRTIPQQIGSLYDALTPGERAISRELLDFIDLRPVARKAEAPDFDPQIPMPAGRVQQKVEVELSLAPALKVIDFG